VNGEVLATLAALGAALGLAVSTVLEHAAAAARPTTESLRLRLLAHLARQPLWLAGVIAEIVAYLLQFVALDHSSLVLVQVLLVAGLLFALPLGAALRHRRITGAELAGAGLVVAGIAAFLIAARPSGGRHAAPAAAWVGLIAADLAIAAAMLLVARGASGVRRAVSLALAGGVANAVTAALSKTAVHLLAHGVVALLESWAPYAVIASGVAGTLIVQSAFQAGSLPASLPTLTAVDPIASIAIGTMLFGEHVNDAGAARGIEAAGLAAMIAGIFILGRSAAVLAGRWGRPAGAS
jgi:drug/metabolite transporter (DMT)-like permease